MSITTEVNEAKDNLDIAHGELNRLFLLLDGSLDLIPNGEQIALSLSVATSKVRRVRASL